MNDLCPVDLYLDLMQKCLIGTIYEDPNCDRWGEKIFDPAKRDGGRDWPLQAHSMIGNRRMSQLRFAAEYCLKHDIPGDFIETGVWRGGACILLRAILKAYGVKDRRVFVADSFCGLPKPSGRFAEDKNDAHHTFSELAVSLETVKANFSKYGLLDDQVVFLEGWFKDTLPAAPIERLAILRLDGDMYESTMDGLRLYEKLSPGGFLIVDDYFLPGCKKAVHDFRAWHRITDRVLDIDGMASFWQKAA